MIKARSVVVAALVVIVGLGAYAATVATRSAAATPPATDDAATEALLGWLDASGTQREQLRGEDPAFAHDLRELRTQLALRRAELAAALTAPDTSEAALMDAVEAVIAADSTLERRVARYLLAVRKHLTPDQQRRLFGLCAERIGRGRGGGGGGGPWGPGFGRADGSGTQPAGPARIRAGRGAGQGGGPHGEGYRRGAGR